MERIPEYGICRLVQSYLTAVLKMHDYIRQACRSENVHSQDEGDFETKLTASMSRHDGIALMISMESLGRTGPSASWEIGFKIECIENVRMNRSEEGVRYTALQTAEAVLAILHETQMPTGPFAWIEAASNAIELASETPVLMYTARIRARLAPTLKF